MESNLNRELSAAWSYLSQLLYLGTFYPDDAPSQALVDQQSQLAVEVHPVVMLVLHKEG